MNQDLRRMMYVAPLSSDATIHAPSPACARRDAADRADDIGPHSFASNCTGLSNGMLRMVSMMDTFLTRYLFFSTFLLYISYIFCIFAN